MNYITTRIYTSLGLIFLIYLCLKSIYVLFITLLFLSYKAIDEFFSIHNKIFKNNKFLKFVSSLISILYVTFFALVIWFSLSPAEYSNVLMLIFLLLICVSTDIGGFIFGKIIGGKKLTKISPKKTYSGMIGSFLFSIIFGYLFYFTQKNNLILNINVFSIILLVSLTSQLGDLMISFLKRKAKIKDTGSMLPGHGGILDRIDGILVAIPLGTFLISI